MMDQIFAATFPTEAETQTFAARIAPLLRAGDVLLLEGEIGAGKSAFCRACIRALCGPDTEVPSPTFTLVQIYDHPGGEIWHADLYRLSDPQETIELGLLDAFENAICLIEWPDRLADLRPQNALTLRMFADQNEHRGVLLGPPAWTARLENMHA